MQQLTMLGIQEGVKAAFVPLLVYQALMAMIEQDAAAVAGPRGKHDPDRTTCRHGYQGHHCPPWEVNA